MDKKDYSKEKPVSELFKRIITRCSSTVFTCELCGRTYFINDEAEHEEGELKGL